MDPVLLLASLPQKEPRPGAEDHGGVLREQAEAHVREARVQAAAGCRREELGICGGHQLLKQCRPASASQDEGAVHFGKAAPAVREADLCCLHDVLELEELDGAVTHTQEALLRPLPRVRQAVGCRAVEAGGCAPRTRRGREGTAGSRQGYDDLVDLRPQGLQAAKLLPAALHQQGDLRWVEAEGRGYLESLQWHLVQLALTEEEVVVVL
mmetsp:Transcript_12468/g.38580  ORF Transcript_12468/g.38580 Transcript_12468/m.38580 type:complete len:210 (+) Transcript_12468:813-1442(+)